MFEYIKTDKKVKSLHIVKNGSTIKLDSSLVDDETFRTSFKIDYIKPIASALLSENITIYVDENKPLMFNIKMDDKAIEMRVITEIIDSRSLLE
jgi:hypothetical protein